MTIALTINGTTYDYPENGDIKWGPDATDWASAVTTGMLQKAGGLFQLLGEVDFGSGFGIKSLYLSSRSDSSADDGILRLAVADTIDWRNNADSANLALAVDGSDNLTFNGTAIGNFVSVTDTNSINLTLTSGALSADVNLSTAAADVGFQVVQSSIKTDGVFGQISKTFSSLTLTGASGAIIGTTGVLSSEAQLNQVRGGTGVNNAGTLTYGSNNLAFTTSGATSLTLPTTGTVATIAGTQTLTNKTIDGGSNTLTNIAITSLATVLADANKAIVRDGSGVVTSALIVNANISATAAIARTAIATGTANHVVINSGTGALSSEAQLVGTRGGTGISNAGTLTYGANALTFTTSGTTSLTLPTTGTVATTGGTETLSNKTLLFAIVAGDLEFLNQAPCKFYEKTINGTNFIALEAPDAVTTDTIFKLPNGDGMNGQFIVTDGMANLGWGNATGLVNPMTTAGDMIYGGTSGAAVRLPAPGAAGYMLASTSSTVNAFTQTPTLVGTSAALTTQAAGSSDLSSLQGFSATAAVAPNTTFARSKNGTIGSHTIVASGDALGSLTFKGSNGTSFDPAAQIIAEVDSTPGASADMPGRLRFLTTTDGTATLTEAMRITNGQFVLAAATSPNTSGAKFQVGGSGITYPASPTLSTDANTMEGYKESAFVTSVSFGGASVGITTASSEGSYTRIGNRVFFSGDFFFSNKGSSAGQFRLNLPYTIANMATGAGARVIGGFVNFGNINLTPIAVSYGGNTGDTFVFFFCGSTTGSTPPTFDNTVATNTTFIAFSIMYTTNDAF